MQWKLIAYSSIEVPLPPSPPGYIVGIAEHASGQKLIVNIPQKYGSLLSIGVKGSVHAENNVENKPLFVPGHETSNSLPVKKVALITGSSRGIGRAIACELANNGVSVVVNNTRNREQGLRVLAEIENQGGTGIYVSADVSDFAEVAKLIGEIIGHFGRIDILVNNAGIVRDKMLENMTADQWNDVLNTNLTSAFYCAQQAVKHMKRQGGGRIINISSVVGEYGNIGQSNYAAAKGALISLTKTIAKEYAKYNILANAVAPGFIETSMLDRVPPYVLKRILEQIPLGRLGRPEEVAKLVRFLVSDDANYITGQVFNINGGIYM